MERSTPEKENISSQAILNFLKKAREKNQELHSIMILKGGKIIFERWWEPYAPQYRHELYSLSKSFTSVAVGMASDEGLLTADTLLSDIFTDEFEKFGSRIDGRVKRMTVKNLLTMSTGMENEYWAGDGPEENNIVSFLTGAVTDDPGRTFRYSTIATYMLSAAITRLTGKTLAEYLDPRLFTPMGINRDWLIDEKTGLSMGGYGLSVTTEDIAKLGQMLLQKGMWEGKRLVSENWIREATRKQISNGNGDGDWAMGYGYQFWQCKPEGVFRGDGMYGQLCVVVPSEGIVIAVTENVADMQLILDLLWEMLEDIKTLPAGGEAGESDTVLAYLDLDNEGEEYPRLTAEYDLGKPEDEQSLNFTSINFDFMGNECVVSFYTEKGKPPQSSFLFINGRWEKAAAPYFGTQKSNRVITNGVWKGNTFTATTWYYETVSRRQYRFTFSGDFAELTVESRDAAYNPFKLAGKGKRKNG
jgi:CubicO group peptidase (beta-lactamase class C family)